MVRRIDLEPRICEYCGHSYNIRLKTEKPFQYLRRRFCSNSCKMKKLRDEWKNKLYTRIYPKVQIQCKNCGKIRYVPPSRSMRPFCDRQCMAIYYDENHHGSNHWNWKGGITELRNRDNDSPEYKQWRKAVFKRDGYKCVRCGNDKSGQLRAHHIKEYSIYPELRYEIDNGLTVCEDCHKEIHYGIKKIQS